LLDSLLQEFQMSSKCARLGKFSKDLLMRHRRFGPENRALTRPLSRSSFLLADKVLLQDQSLKVPSWGGILMVNSNLNVCVKPINSAEDMQMEKAIVKVYGSTEADKQNINLEIKQEGHKLSVNASKLDAETLSDLNCVIEVPLVHNVNVINTGDAKVNCQDMMESSYCHLTSDDGEVRVRRVKTANLIVQTETGDVICNGAIQGSISIVTGDGHVVNDKRFLGPALDVTTDTGNIRVASSYSEQSKFSTNTGSLFLRNIHNESYVAVYEKGNATMMGVDGTTNVFLKNGHLDIQVSKIKHESRLHVESGDITLKISDNHPLKVCVTAPEIIMDAKFSKYGSINLEKEDNYQHYFGTIQPEKFSPTIQVLAENGRVTIESQDWAASLGFKLPGGIEMPEDLDIKQATP